jgi:hypothetical protein
MFFQNEGKAKKVSSFDFGQDEITSRYAVFSDAALPI